MNFLCAFEHINMVFIRFLLKKKKQSKINKRTINSINADAFSLYNRVGSKQLLRWGLQIAENETILQTWILLSENKDTGKSDC